MRKILLITVTFTIPFLANLNVYSQGTHKTETPRCLIVGQAGTVEGIPGAKGWTLNPPCCKGLKDRESLKVCGKGYGGGYVYTCLACGDGKCDNRYESECNCPEDCKFQKNQNSFQQSKPKQHKIEMH